MADLTGLMQIARMVAGQDQASAVREALDHPGHDWLDPANRSVTADHDGRVAVVYLPTLPGQLSLTDLASLGGLSALPPVPMAGDPSTHLLVIDDPALPGLCRAVIAAAAGGQVMSITMTPDIRL